MTKFHEILVGELALDGRFVSDEGELKKYLIIDAAFNMDKFLIETLIKQPQLKQKFFSEIAGHWVFNINLFVQYMENKNFLNDSYTRYRNKIGLTIGNKFMNQRNEVALVWPFKDCVLEGGQSREDQKRPEIFFNQLLAQEEIDQLTEPKVLTNFERYTVDGTQKVAKVKRHKNGTIAENLIIKGNNLLALYSLLPQFEEKVKLIYIDPPYNTGNDSFQYNDNFNHSTWLTFMKNRLEVAKKFLKKEGVILIQTDDAEQAYLKILMDEIFGRDNFVQQIIWKKRSGAPNDKNIGATHEYITIYSRKITTTEIFRKERNGKQKERYKNPDNHPKGPWAPDNLMANVKGGRYVKSLYFPIINPNTNEEHYPSSNGNWRYNKEKIEKLLANNEIYFGIDGQGRPKLKRFLCDVKEGVPYPTIWDFVSQGNSGTKEIQNLFGSVNEFDTAKPEDLIRELLLLTTKESDIILDFFAGSGTTGAVAHKMERQFICIEQMDYIKNVTATRLQKVIGEYKEVEKIEIKKQEAKQQTLNMVAEPQTEYKRRKLVFDEGGISKAVNWQGGGEFIYCELMKYNEAFIEQIQKAENTDTLLHIWEEMKQHSFINYNVDIKKQDESIEELKQLSIEEQKQILFDILNKNQLYVNLSSIDDEDYKVSSEDKKLTNDFYNIKEEETAIQTEIDPQE